MYQIRIHSLLVLAMAVAAVAGPRAWGQYEVTKLTASDASANDHFGEAVANSGVYLIVGARFKDGIGINSGKAYIFARNQEGNVDQVRILAPDDAFQGDEFGVSVAIDGDIAIAGAFHDSDAGTFSGSVYVFYRNHGGTDNWGQFVKRTALDAAATDLFGGSVSISGDIALVGAPGDDDPDDPVDGEDQGSAYIFYRDEGGTNNWGQRVKLTAPAADASEGDKFGSAVSLSGDTAIVGAPFDGNSNRGFAYVFQRDQGGQDTWGLVEKLVEPNSAAENQFGGAVAISGSFAIVGAQFSNNNGADSGSAYIFARDPGGPNWDPVVMLTAADAAEGDSFGCTVSISGDTATVGAPLDDDNESASGSAYIFQRDYGDADWGQVAKIVASDGQASDFFGGSICASGDIVVVGASLEDQAAFDAGASYIFCLCPGDTNLDGLVSIVDFLDLLLHWGACADPDNCPWDLDGNETVEVVDFLALLQNWGACVCSGEPDPMTLAEELADACLTQDDWDEYVDVMTDPQSSSAEKARYDCWMRHYMLNCDNCSCGREICSGKDPFSD